MNELKWNSGVAAARTTYEMVWIFCAMCASSGGSTGGLSVAAILACTAGGMFLGNLLENVSRIVRRHAPVGAIEAGVKTLPKAAARSSLVVVKKLNFRIRPSPWFSTVIRSNSAVQSSLACSAVRARAILNLNGSSVGGRTASTA